ncbi:uncharacterized protein LOC133791514 isoform X2 [Humulus lupulus]|uniref:uncharacterized protein LOC133791514 isoform X2 n=1 Tax=Humulus lupulus TaxID=3486 RepID=UPI002B412F67|nr:uncharacterized protein LOC133791514 isoform X2 [Humulus lupulus]
MENWSAEMEDMKKELFTIAMKGEWESVVKLYERNDLAHRTKITKSGDTALHVAVSDCQEEVIKALVRQVVLKSIAVLSIQNDRGNTPLHFAASIGNVTMCFCLAEADRSLVGVRNKDGETPLFLAALRGKKEAFLCLQSFCDPHHDGSYCRRHDGQTVLHCAISGEYFVMFVDELRPEPKSDLSLLMKRTKDEKKDSYPENYKSCVNFAQLLMHAIETVIIKKDVLLQKSTNHDTENPEALKVAQNTQHKGLQTIPGAQGHQLFPPNYATCFNLFKNLCKSLLIVLGFGSRMIQRIREKKEKHVWSVQILNELLKNASMYEYENTGASPEAVVQPLDEIDETKPYEIFESGDATFLRSMKLINPSTFDNPSKSTNQQENDHIDNQQGEKETAILIAAKNGVTEMVEKILELFPVAIHDMNSEKKNIVLLAVENRQPHVFKMLLKRNILKDSVFQQVDNKGNSALHLAAMLGDYKPWLIPGAALQMQWEIKWYEFVKTSMPPNFFVRYNENRKTAKDLFTETHKGLVQSGGEWLTNTSESCSVVAALIATVAFATSTAVPGGTNENSGKPILEDEPAFEIFAITSLVALCFSVTSVVMFLAILTSRYQEKDFGRDLPRKLLVGLTSLFVSIASMLVSFCAGHFFVLQEKLKYAAFPVYAITCLPVTFFALAQFPLYLDLIWANFKKVPQRSYKVALST